MRRTWMVLCVLLVVPTVAHAQTDKHVAIGASIGVREFMDNHFHKKNPSVSFLYRLSRHPEKHKQGWVWRLAGTAGYSHADYDLDLGGTDTKIGSLRTIPVTGGVERAYRHDRLKIGLSAMAGPSFNHFAVDNSVRPAYESEFGAPLDEVKVKNSFAARGGLGVWYDLSRRFGLHAGAYYMYNRPNATITTGGVSTSEKWKTDHVSVSTGLVVGLF